MEVNLSDQQYNMSVARMKQNNGKTLHVLKSQEEKLIDVKQQVRTATVLILGDLTLPNNKKQQLPSKISSTTAVSHPSSSNCCHATHYIPPELASQPDSAQCKFNNRQLMRHIVEAKMKKNKYFHEMKILPVPQPVMMVSKS